MPIRTRKVMIMTMMMIMVMMKRVNRDIKTVTTMQLNRYKHQSNMYHKWSKYTLMTRIVTKKTKMKMRPRQQKNALVVTQPDAGRK